MFIKETKTKRKDGSYVSYLQLVESLWDKGSNSPRHKVIYSFGRQDELNIESLKRLVESLKKYLEPEDAIGPEFHEFLRARELGVVHLMDGLWTQLRIDNFFKDALRKRKYEVPIERALFAMVAQRVCCPGSKLACEYWVTKGAYINNFRDVQVQQLYRAMDFLIEHGKELEKELFSQINELLDLDLSVVFYDTTAFHFEIENEDGLRRRGHEKGDNPGGQPQIVVGLAINKRGIPIRHWVWPGNMSDVSTVKEVVKDLKWLRPRRFFFVGDRGMVSQENVDYLESQGLKYILGVKLRRNKIAEKILAIRGRYRKINDDLFVKEKKLKDGERDLRYILCKSEATAKREHERREAILSYIRENLNRPKAPEDGTKWNLMMRAHSVYGRYLKSGENGRLIIDEDSVQRESNLDGKYILMSNDFEASTAEIVLGYKELHSIEKAFETMKGALDARPIYHRIEDRIRAHIHLCVLAYTLMRTVEDRTKDTWCHIERTLSQLKAGEIRFNNGIAVHRGELLPEMKSIYHALRIDPPSRVLELSN